MQALFVKTLTGDTVINLDNVSHIKVNDAKPSLDFWIVNETYPISFFLTPGTEGHTVINRLKKAFAPLYEGRQGTVLGIELELDLADLERARDVF